MISEGEILKVNFIDVLDRALSGSICSERKWDTKVIPTSAREKLEEYGLVGTCDPENPINIDDSLADGFWKAGFDLAVDTGMFCLSTERVIKFSEAELKTVLEEVPGQLKMGKGLDEIVIKPRKPEDPERPLNQLGPFGSPLDEDLFIPAHMAVAQHRTIDMLNPGTLYTIYGRPIRSGTPYETLAGKYEAMLTHEALRRVGRPEMVSPGVMSSITEYAQLGGYGIPDGYDLNHLYLILFPVELKTDYSMLHKAAHAFNCNASVQGGTVPLIGGYAGPPEGAALMVIAGEILNIAVHRAIISGCTCSHIRFPASSGGRESLWANSIAIQARARNSNILKHALTQALAGPCTEMLLYEHAAQTINYVVSGAVFILGARTARGSVPNHVGVLENLLVVEIAKACAGMTRSEANEIVKALIPKYEDKMEKPPPGKSFSECINLRTLQPTKEWKEIYDKVGKDLGELGIAL